MSSAPKIKIPRISRRSIPILISGVLFVAASIYFIWLASAPSGPTIVSGNIEADQVHLGTRLGGTVDRLNVEEGNYVKKDQTLVIVKVTAGDTEQIRSPIEGVVLECPFREGELVMAGSILVTVGDLKKLNLTVYVPEERYGQIFLGQNYPVKVDSYPGKVFWGRVSHIADTAEFTPRNVQTVQGRKDTVYAVRLVIDNPDLQLKPGMPADVTLEQK